MLASTVQFSTTNRPPPGSTPADPTPAPPHGRHEERVVREPGRPRHEDHDPPGRGRSRPPPRGPLPQDPTACLRPPPHHPLRSPLRTTPDRGRHGAVLEAGSSRRPNWSAFHPRAPPHTLRRHPQMGTDHGVGAALDRQTPGLPATVLLRKEVIQPHLPVRLPCYDFVPIADPAFDGSL